MIFCHVVADYNQQGILSKMKQRSWWREHTTNKLFDNDYKMALFMHSFAWSFIVEIPLSYLAFTQHNIHLAWITVIFYILNTFIHYRVDDLKANQKTINLSEDQSIHLVQILITWIVAMGAL